MGSYISKADIECFERVGIIKAKESNKPVVVKVPAVVKEKEPPCMWD